MSWASWSAFVVAVTALCVVPGPAVLLVLSQALSHGTAKAVWSILGITAAGTAWFVLSATGIGAVLTASYDLFFAIKWIGVAYLVWLGIATFLRTSKLAALRPAVGPADARRLFAGGFVLQMANPNVLLFFTAFLPQFIDPHAALWPQIAILALTTAVIELVVQLGYAMLAGRLREMASAQRFATITDRVAGVLLVAAGLGMAAIRRA
jgi:threonine/homoserine/homoserine lactone efflux protein